MKKVTYVTLGTIVSGLIGLSASLVAREVLLRNYNDGYPVSIEQYRQDVNKGLAYYTLGMALTGTFGALGAYEKYREKQNAKTISD